MLRIRKAMRIRKRRGRFFVLDMAERKKPFESIEQTDDSMHELTAAMVVARTLQNFARMLA
jgi:hypothetical protein